MDRKTLLNTLSSWARGHLRPSISPQVIVCESPGIDWLERNISALEARPLLLASHNCEIPAWLTEKADLVLYRGNFSGRDDDIEIGEEDWLQLTDYLSTRFITVSGPTIVQVFDQEDVEIFISDFIPRGGYSKIPEILMSSSELASQCALSGRNCSTNAALSRLYIGNDCIIRTFPNGRSLGTCQNSLDELRANLSTLVNAGVDPCVSEAVWQALPKERSSLARVIDSSFAIRTMAWRTKSPWLASGINGRLSPNVSGSVSTLRASNLHVLWSESNYVIFDISQGRAFKVDKNVAQSLEFLIDGSETDAMAYIKKSWGSGATIDKFMDELSQRGIILQHNHEPVSI